MATLEVVVEGHGVLTAAPEALLLEVCEDAGLPIEAACGGFACCNTCRVEVLDGSDGLSPLLPEEAPFLDSPAQRLACQARIVGNLRVRLAPGE